MLYDSGINSRFDILFLEEMEEQKKIICQECRIDAENLCWGDKDKSYNCYQYDSGISSRFDILIFETAEEYLKRRKIEKEKLRVEVEKERKEVEKEGVCQGCEEKIKNLRWVDDGDMYVCYHCFYENLSNMASVDVPMRNATQMRDYIEEFEWDEMCENNE